MIVMVVVFFVFVSYFPFVVCFYLDSGGPHPLKKRDIFFIGRAVQSRTPHFIKVSHFFLSPGRSPCFHYTT